MVATIIALFALALSATTFYLTFFRRGLVCMTTPAFIAFGYDKAAPSGDLTPKVVVRSLLFSTGRRGWVIETLFACLRHGPRTITLPVWGLNESSLERGSGLFVSETGVPAWHHFLPATGTDFRFGPGEYHVEILARIHGVPGAKSLGAFALRVPEDLVPTADDSNQVWFDVDPETGRYYPRLSQKDGQHRSVARRLSDPP